MGPFFGDFLHQTRELGQVTNAIDYLAFFKVAYEQNFMRMGAITLPVFDCFRRASLAVAHSTEW